MWRAPEGSSLRWPAKLNQTVDLHLHLGRSRDGASLTTAEILKAMDQYGISRSVVFAIDEPDSGITYKPTNHRVIKACSSHSRLIPFVRLNPRAKTQAFEEFRRCLNLGVRGVKLHPRSEKFSPAQAEPLIDEIEQERLPILIHSSHEKNCGPILWEKIFRRHKQIPFVLLHAGKDSYQEAIAVARRNSHVWLETSTLSYWRTRVVLHQVGASRVVFGSDLPYSHPAMEQAKFNLLLNGPDRQKVFWENAKKILGE